jgi:ABC-type nitrate/sulfonate/bicarbonate transport system permease component
VLGQDLATTRPAAPTGAMARQAAFWRATTRRLSGFVLVLALLVVWELSARLGWTESRNWPPLSSVLVETVRDLASGGLAQVLASSIARMLVGYTIGSLCGVALGLLIATIPPLDRSLTPIVEALRPLPVPAIVPPLILFFGIDDALKIFVVSVAVFFPVLVSTVGGVRGIDEVLIRTGRTFRAGRVRMLVSVILPAAAPSVFSGLRVSIALALVTTVVAEMIAGSSGIGYVIVRAQYALRPEEMYAAVLCLMVVGYLLNRLFLAVEHRVLHWYEASDPHRATHNGDGAWT